ncbi:hypothetical protein MTO96_011645 [Rhipicephalus appendiculatus]
MCMPIICATPVWNGRKSQRWTTSSNCRMCPKNGRPNYFDDDASTADATPVEHGAYAATGNDYAPKEQPTTPGA